MVLDSNILIGYLNGDERIVSTLHTWNTEGRVLCISTITYAEVLAHPALTPKEVNETRRFLHRFVVLPFDDTIADKAAEVRRAHHVTLPDAGIIATAIIHHLPLVTRDKVLQKVPGVSYDML